VSVASYFFDSSAIVRRYRREPETAWVQSLCEPRTHPPIYISELAQVEVVAALRRLGRHEGLHPSSVDATQNIFERHLVLSDPGHALPVYDLVAVSAVALSLAAALCTKYWEMRPHPLRSLDAIQLACAIATATGLPDELIFVTADARLSAVAPLEGFRVINPVYPPHP
jgi:predicted nucleic acid-binding protein